MEHRLHRVLAARATGAGGVSTVYLNVCVPGLQYPAGLVTFVHRQLGLPIASTAPLGTISDRFSTGMRHFASAGRLLGVG